ncbi:nesprin-1-like [Elysia marginata]|uniref:Nesprin-1-like n=1 Tax=Elysia marginata TaxID=1093978 RepID=A0AAV4GI22_9GAST|nr:nesprin-1-like [Elysia marginata]
MAEAPGPERHVERWERTEVIGHEAGRGHTVEGRAVIVHRRPDRHAFLTHSLAVDDPNEGDEDVGIHAKSNQFESQDVSGHDRETSGDLQRQVSSTERGDGSGDSHITWTTTWQGVLDETPSCVHEGGEHGESLQRFSVESSPVDTDISLEGLAADFTEAQPLNTELVFSTRDFMAEEAFMIGLDGGGLGLHNRESATDKSMEIGFDSTGTNVIVVNRGDVLVDRRDLRAEEALMVGIDSCDADVDSRDFRTEEAFMIGVDMGGAGVDNINMQCKTKEYFSIRSGIGDEGVDGIEDKVVGHVVGGDYIDDDDVVDNVADVTGADGGHVTVLRRVERSFSIGEDGRKSQVTDRLLERRKTIEVNKEDLSGLEVIHTSSLDIMIGGDREREGQNEVSEINVIWGKTVEADLSNENDSLVESPCLTSPTVDSCATSSVGDTDTADYWSGDVSIGTARSSGSFETYVDTGDSMFASDSTDSPVQSVIDYQGSSGKPCHSTPRATRDLERSEAFHSLWDAQVSPLQTSRSVSVWEAWASQPATISSQPRITLDTGLSQVSVNTEQGNRVVSRVEITCRDTAPDSGNRATQPEQGFDNPGDEDCLASRDLFRVSEDMARPRDLFRVSEDIARPSVPGERDTMVGGNNSHELYSVLGSAEGEDCLVFKCESVDRREEYLERDKEEPKIIRQARPVVIPFSLHPVKENSRADLDVKSGPSKLNVSGGKTQESVDSTRTFDDEGFVPLAGKKKKKLRKKKKKNKAGLRDSDTMEDVGATGPGDEEKPQPIPGGDSRVPGAATFLESVGGHLSGDVQQVDIECASGETGLQQHETDTTAVSIETINIVSDGGQTAVEDVLATNSETLDFEDNSQTLSQDSEPTVTDVLEAVPEDKTLSFFSRTESKDPDVLTDQDYLNQVLQTASLDPATFLLHSEGQGGDILLNVSKGRRRILKPHRRYTKDRGESGETEPRDVVDGGTSRDPDNLVYGDTVPVTEDLQPGVPDSKDATAADEKIDVVSSDGKATSTDVDGVSLNIHRDSAGVDLNDFEVYNIPVEPGGFAVGPDGQAGAVMSGARSGEETIVSVTDSHVTDQDDNILGSPGSSGTVPSSSGIVPSSSGTVPGSSGTVLSSSGTVPSSSGIVPGSSGTVPDSSGTVTDRKEEKDVKADQPQPTDNNPLMWPKKGKKKKNKKKSKKEKSGTVDEVPAPTGGFELSESGLALCDDSARYEGGRDQTAAVCGVSSEETHPVSGDGQSDSTQQQKHLSGERGYGHGAGSKGDTLTQSGEHEAVARLAGLPDEVPVSSPSGYWEGDDADDGGSHQDEGLSVIPNASPGLQAVDRVDSFCETSGSDTPATVRSFRVLRNCESQIDEASPRERFLMIDYKSDVTNEVVAGAGVTVHTMSSVYVDNHGNNVHTDSTFATDMYHAGGEETIDGDTAHIDSDGAKDIDVTNVSVGVTDPGPNEAMDSHAKDAINNNTIDVGDNDTVAADSDREKTVLVDNKDTLAIHMNSTKTTEVGGDDTVYFDATDDSGNVSVYVDATDDVGEESIEADDGRKLDDLIKDLVSDVDLVAVRDIRIYIDDDLVKKVDDIVADQATDATDLRAVSEGGVEGMAVLDESDDDRAGVATGWIQTGHYVDRREEYEPVSSPGVVSRRLLEDVDNNRARAQEVATRDPEAVSATLTPGGELTAGGHLLSEMALLETAAREQADSLKLAVTQQATYEAQLEHLNSAISEAQGKLLSSPVMASSVGALKQQMAEHDVRTDSYTIWNTNMLHRTSPHKSKSKLQFQYTRTLAPTIVPGRSRAGGGKGYLPCYVARVPPTSPVS